MGHFWQREAFFNPGIVAKKGGPIVVVANAFLCVTLGALHSLSKYFCDVVDPKI